MSGRDPKKVPSERQLRMLDWFAQALYQNLKPSPEDVDLWRRRIRQVGTLPDPELEKVRVTFEANLSRPLTEDLLDLLADMANELSVMADPENEEGYEGPARNLSDNSWPLDSIEELHSEMGEHDTCHE